MKKFSILLAAAFAALSASADEPVFTRSGDMMEIEFTVDLSETRVKSNQALTYSPKIVGATDSLDLDGAAIYGRRRYIYYMRNGGIPAERAYKASEMPDKISFKQTVPYGDWMNGSLLKVDCAYLGCCNNILFETSVVKAAYESTPFVPVIIYMQPDNPNVEKRRDLSGSAFIDFPVNQTVIYPDYRNNTAELGKISQTIDSVKGDPDVTIREVWLKGYASPEGKYDHNTMLARGRVAALKDHLQGKYHFPDGLIVTEYEPEDWEGLRRRVVDSNLPNRDTILSIIDLDIDLDAKDWRMKIHFPDDYKIMYENWYPALRHTDYRIEYTIRQFTEPSEIAYMMATAPDKLSIGEFAALSNSYEPGSDEFNNVWQTAVSVYPNDHTANYNAACAALERGDLAKAKAYLSHAGYTPMADYLRGVYNILAEDYPAAYTYLKQAKGAGVDQAQSAIDWLLKEKKVE